MTKKKRHSKLGNNKNNKERRPRQNIFVMSVGSVRRAVEERGVEFFPQSEDVSGTGSFSPLELRSIAVRGRPRSQISLPRLPSRLPYLTLCSVAALAIIAGIAFTAYKLHTGGLILDLFNQSLSFMSLSNGSSSNDLNSSAAAVDSRYLLKHEKKALLTQSSCRTDACVWAETYLRGRLNTSVTPCTDFYAHVCSHHWMAHDLQLESRAYKEMTAGVMMMDVEKFFRMYLEENEERYLKYPGVFLHQAISVLSKCQSETKSNKGLFSVQTLLAEYNLAKWPYKKPPGAASVDSIAAFVDRDFGVFPFARVFLRKPFEDDRAYTVHIDAPSFTIKRYNLAYLDESPDNFTHMVAFALSLFDERQNMSEQAQAIVGLEKELNTAALAPRFTEFPDSMRRVGQLYKQGKWKWNEYLTILFQDIETFNDNKSVIIMNNYVTKLASILNKSDTVTLLNYIGYRLLVHLSPLLPKVASSLLRLSHDDYLQFVPDRMQACMHLLERLYKHGMRFFGRMTFSKNNSTLLLKHYDNSFSNLDVHIKSSMADRLLSSSSWLERSSIGIGVDKLENMRLIFLGSGDDINVIANYYNFNAQPLDPNHLVESFRELQSGTMNIYWETKPPKDDLDARFDHTALYPGHEYFFGRNVLFVPHANIAFLNSVATTIEPVFFPLVLTEVFRGMFGAVDRRGAFVDHNLAMSTWWNPDEMSKFSQIEVCFQDQYYAEIRDLVGENFEARIKLGENVADNAILGPLHDMYMKVLASRDGADKLVVSIDERQLDMQQLFFVLYVVGLCDNPSRDSWARMLKFGDIPGKLRVNIPLKNFRKFSDAFGCSEGTPMNPARKCTIW